jgi:hypothetical protein
MMPSGGLSSQVIDSAFVGARSQEVSSVIDYEDGGAALNDASQGLQVRAWRGRLIGNDVILDADGVAPTVIYTESGITEISFSFDQNMRPVLAFVRDGLPFLRWFDGSLNQTVNYLLPVDAITPRVTLDDKRATQIGVSDVIVAYVRGGNLCTRIQRDRFLIEYVYAPVETGLIKIGMNTKDRLQFLFETPVQERFIGYASQYPITPTHINIAGTGASRPKRGIVEYSPDGNSWYELKTLDFS